MLAMTEVLHSPSHFASTSRTVTSNSSASSSSSSSSLIYAPFNSLACTKQTPPEGDDAYGIVFVEAHIPDAASSALAQDGCSTDCETLVKLEVEEEKGDDQRTQRLSLFAFLVTLFRKSLIACRSDRRELCAMEIGWPTEVQHVAHVTFDRFNGFLGLPVEFEPEVPRRPPSASSSVFGVSTESMQLSYDSRGNSVPTILLLMQSRLYSQGGLQSMGIFRINAENGHKEYVRDKLNRGEVPEGIDVHCLAGLIKAWFRELPTGVLDSLSPDQVMQCQSEEECGEPVRHLPPTEAALLDWAINLMADVVEHEHLNRMNARNVAMVFAPNMTRMVDPLTALMYAVQVMNFLKTLILRTLRERKGSVVEPSTKIASQRSDDSGNRNPSQSFLKEAQGNSISEEPTEEYSSDSHQRNLLSGGESGSMMYCSSRNSQSSNASSKWDSKIKSSAAYDPGRSTSEEPKGISNLGRFDSKTEQIEAWL